MLASIYRLKSNGVKLPRPDGPVVGDLRMRPEEVGNVKMRVARLMGGQALELLPALLKADASTISPHGMVIHGTEVISRGQQKSKGHPVPQTWWAFILTEKAIHQYDGEDPLDAFADRNACGF